MTSNRIALEAYLHHNIPLSSAMGIRVIEAAVAGVHLRAPLGPNINHQQTAFGGSIAAIATSAAWSLVWVRLREAETRANIVIASEHVQFLRPIRSELVAETLPANPKDWERFFQTLVRKGKARVAVNAVVRASDESDPGATFEGEFVAILP